FLNPLLFRCASFFANTGGFTETVALIVKFSPANAASFVYSYRFDIRGKDREDPFHTDTVGNLADCKCSGTTATLTLDNIPLERLYPFLGTFDDPVIHGHIISGFKLRQFLNCLILFVYECNCFHDKYLMVLQ